MTAAAAAAAAVGSSKVHLSDKNKQVYTHLRGIGITRKRVSISERKSFKVVLFSFLLFFLNQREAKRRAGKGGE